MRRLRTRVSLRVTIIMMEINLFISDGRIRDNYSYTLSGKMYFERRSFRTLRRGSRIGIRNVSLKSYRTFQSKKKKRKKGGVGGCFCGNELEIQIT